jgi:hypothetical protein
LDLIQEEQQWCNVDCESEVYAIERERDAAGGVEVRSIQQNGLAITISISIAHRATILTIANVAIAHLLVM